MTTFAAAARMAQSPTLAPPLALASALHEQWRQTRTREDGTYVQFVKVDDDFGVECDLAGTEFANLTPQWHTERLLDAIAALAAAEVAGEHTPLGGPEAVDFVTEYVHDQRLVRSGVGARPDMLAVPVVARAALDAVTV